MQIPDKLKIKILKNLDIDAARPYFKELNFKQAYGNDGKPMSEDDVILAAIHKARLKMPKLFNKNEKAESRKWLFDHHMTVEM